MVAPDTFCFLNETYALASAEDWNRPDHDKLWLYNLHYFDDLCAVDGTERNDWHRALLDRWIAENPAPHGNGWEPYPLSLRIVNWIRWFLGGERPEPRWLDSLALQVRVLAQRLEWHLLGNHLFANAKALVFGGLYFSGPEARNWLRTGLDILDEQVPEQVLADGGHFERSPMYHAIITEDLLDLINLARMYATDGITAEDRAAGLDERLNAAVPQWRGRLPAMLGWLDTVSHPDGRIALFNDAAFDIAADPEDLRGYAAALGLSPVARPGRLAVLDASGYFRAEAGPAVLIGDVGEIGPDYLPGHAHADTLSFELSLYGQRLIVDSGTSVYGTSPERLRQRATAAHNTVVVDDADSSEVWGGFRVARRARPLPVTTEASGDGAITIDGGHDGYRRLTGRPVHWRRWRLSQDGLVITDWLDGSYRRAQAYFHFSPGITAARVTNGASGSVSLPGGGLFSWLIEGGVGTLIRSTYHPEFGCSEKTICLQVDFAGPNVATGFEWMKSDR